MFPVITIIQNKMVQTNEFPNTNAPNPSAVISEEEKSFVNQLFGKCIM